MSILKMSWVALLGCCLLLIDYMLMKLPSSHSEISAPCSAVPVLNLYILDSANEERLTLSETDIFDLTSHLHNGARTQK